MTPDEGPTMFAAGAEPLNRAMPRRQLLKLGLAMVGTGALASCGRGSEKTATTGSTAAAASHPPVESEPGTLSLVEWVGNDEKGLWRDYARTFPKQPPKFQFQSSDDESLAKALSGTKRDLIHPDADYVQDWVDADLIQPFDTKLLKNFHSLNPLLTKVGQINGQQYFIPGSWGFTSVIYRADKVKPAENSWSLMYDPRYKNKISIWDQGVWVMGIEGIMEKVSDPWNMTDGQLESVRTNLSKKNAVVRDFWSSVTSVEQDIASGDIDIALIFPGGWTRLKQKGLDVVYLDPQEGRLAWVDGFVLSKDTKNYRHAHAYVDAWVSADNGPTLATQGIASPNLKVDITKIPRDVVDVLKLKDPVSAIENANLIKHTADRKKYLQIWDQLKAG